MRSIHKISIEKAGAWHRVRCASNVVIQKPVRCKYLTVQLYGYDTSVSVFGRRGCRQRRHINRGAVDHDAANWITLH